MKKYYLPVFFLLVLVLASKTSSAAKPSDYGLKEGDLISAIFSKDPDIYIINADGYKRLFLNPEIFKFYGHLGGFANIKLVTQEVRDSFPTSGLFRDCEENDPKVYGIQVSGEDKGDLRWVNTSGEQAVKDDANFFKKVFCINKKEFNWYPKGNELKTVKEVPRYERSVETTTVNTEEKLKENSELKETGQVVICHYPPGNTAEFNTLTVSVAALKSHLNDGDRIGACPVATPTPTPTCISRPTCLDSVPRCLPPEPIGGWCPVSTPTPMPTITTAPTPTISVTPVPTSIFTPTSTPSQSTSTPTPTSIITLTPTPTLTPTLTLNKFVIGQQVITNATVNVRQTPSGTLLGTQALGAIGAVTAGPTSAVLNGAIYIWWNINFNSGVDGWVVEDGLGAYTVPTPTPSVSIAPTPTPSITPTPTSSPTPTPISTVAKTCIELQSSQKYYFDLCSTNKYDNVCFDKFSSAYKGCTQNTYNDCTLYNTTASQNILCPVVPFPVPTPTPTPTPSSTPIPTGPPAPTGGTNAGGLTGSGWPPETHSLAVRFNYATGNLAQVKSFRFYQKRPGETGFTLIETFNDPGTLASTCSGNVSGSAWRLSYVCSALFWEINMKTSQPASYFSVGDYEFYITAANSSSLESSPSPTQKITVKDPTVIISPTETQSPITLPLTFRWTTTTGTGYPYIELYPETALTQYADTIYYKSVSSGATSYVYDGPALDPTKKYLLVIHYPGLVTRTTAGDYTTTSFPQKAEIFRVYSIPNTPPATPGPFSGSLSAIANSASWYDTMICDSNGDQIKAIFDWGDGTFSESSLYTLTGDQVCKNFQLSHVWTVPGTYTVRVRGRDQLGAESSWSAITVNSSVVVSTPTPTPVSVKPTDTGTNNPTAISHNLYIGSTGNDVRRLQALLVNEVGYSADLVTGYFGRITRDAVKKFQEKYNIAPALGYFGILTRQRLQELYPGRY